MPDLLKTGSDWLAGMMAQFASSDVTYARRDASVISLPAGRGRTTFQADDGAGGLITFQSEDFLIDPAALVLVDVATLPQKGDTITTAAGEVYEVHAPGREPCWRWCDAYRNRLRVHTKLSRNP